MYSRKSGWTRFSVGAGIPRVNPRKDTALQNGPPLIAEKQKRKHGILTGNLRAALLKNRPHRCTAGKRQIEDQPCFLCRRHGKTRRLKSGASVGPCPAPDENKGSPAKPVSRLAGLFFISRQLFCGRAYFLRRAFSRQYANFRPPPLFSLSAAAVLRPPVPAAPLSDKD